MAGAAALATAACGSGGGGGDGVTLNFYTADASAEGINQSVQACNEQAGGRWNVRVEALPSDADQQREQVVRRLAARDSAIDLIGMDIIWTAEFAEAGWILPWEGEDEAAATEGVIEAVADTARYQGTLWAAPWTTNAQLLWYRTDRVPEPPGTWDEVLDQAEAIGADGTVQVQGGRYEGLTVFFNSLLNSAGGSIVDENGELVLEEEPTVRALEVLQRVATSPQADPSLSNNQEDQTRLAFQTGGSSFMVNWPFVWPSAQAEVPEIHAEMGFAPWPSVEEGQPSRISLGGRNIGIGAYTDDPEAAFEAATCIRSAQNQVLTAVNDGLVPSIGALYDDPQITETLPFAPVLREQIANGVPRPVTPAYNDISRVVQRVLHPPRSIDPQADYEELRSEISRALESGGLL